MPVKLRIKIAGNKKENEALRSFSFLFAIPDPNSLEHRSQVFQILLQYQY
jgi:hypothetical protein